MTKLFYFFCFISINFTPSKKLATFTIYETKGDIEIVFKNKSKKEIPNMVFFELYANFLVDQIEEPQIHINYESD